MPLGIKSRAGSARHRRPLTMNAGISGGSSKNGVFMTGGGEGGFANEISLQRTRTFQGRVPRYYGGNSTRRWTTLRAPGQLIHVLRLLALHQVHDYSHQYPDDDHPSGED